MRDDCDQRQRQREKERESIVCLPCVVSFNAPVYKYFSLILKTCERPKRRKLHSIYAIRKVEPVD